MARFIQRGERINITNDSEHTIIYGEVVSIGNRIGIALSNIGPGAVGVLHVAGVYEIQAESEEEFLVGDTVYLNESGNITKTVGDVIAGWVIENKSTNISVAKVKIG